MVLYRAHFLAHSGKRFGVEHFDAEDDEAAIAHARKHLSSPWGKEHEVWQADRLVHREIYK